MGPHFYISTGKAWIGEWNVDSNRIFQCTMVDHTDESERITQTEYRAACMKIAFAILNLFWSNFVLVDIL